MRVPVCVSPEKILHYKYTLFIIVAVYTFNFMLFMACHLLTRMHLAVKCS